MAETFNPYQPPRTEVPSWWSRFLAWLQRGSFAFLQGKPLILEGIQFYIDPQEPGVLYAASPAKKISDTTVQLVIAEVRRLTPELIQLHPSMHSLLHGRKICVRLINTYEDGKAQTADFVIDDWEN